MLSGNLLKPSHFWKKEVQCDRFKWLQIFNLVLFIWDSYHLIKKRRTTNKAKHLTEGWERLPGVDRGRVYQIKEGFILDHQVTAVEPCKTLILRVRQDPLQGHLGRNSHERWENAPSICFTFLRKIIYLWICWNQPLKMFQLECLY